MKLTDIVILEAAPTKPDAGKFASAKNAVSSAEPIPLGKDFVSTKVAGLSSPSGVAIRVPNITKKLLKESPVKKLKIADISTGQGYLHRPTILNMLDAEDSALRKDKIVAVEQDDKYYVIDGNHRIAALKLRGETEVDAIVIPAREKKSSGRV